MEYDMDELHRRREQRQQEQKAQKARLRQRRSLLIKLGLAAAVLLTCAVLIVAFTHSRPGGEEPSQQTNAVQDTQSAQSTQPPQSPETVIRFAAAGDLNVTDGVVASGGMDYDYTNAFMDVLPLLSNADLTAVNLEGILCGAPYGGENRSAPQPLMNALAAAGVDIVQVANSYSIRKGVSSLATTLRSVELAGMDPVGAFADKEEFNRSGGYNIYNIKGVKVAVVAFTKGMDSMALPAGSEKCVNVLYTDYSSTYQDVDTQGITKLLRAIEKEKPDVTVALLHWGSEYNDTHSKTQDQIKELMISEGVDAIIGTHPHYLQEMVYDQSAGTFVAYSLGDFFGDGDKAGTEYSVVLNLEITKNNETGDTRISGYSYTPIFTAKDPQGLLRVLRLETAIAAYEAGYIERVTQAEYESMVYAMKRIQERIHPETK